jgi:hypothetical protein
MSSLRPVLRLCSRCLSFKTEGEDREERGEEDFGG